jgi:FixJ family two-component response regulator
MIAVVDDDVSVRKALLRVLCAAGYECRAFGSARELLDAPWRQPPDCLVIDLQMPGISGLALSRMLQGTGLCVPIIMMTALEESRLAGECLEEGTVVCLAKPLDDRVLLAAIEVSLARGPPAYSTEPVGAERRFKREGVVNSPLDRCLPDRGPAS